MIWTFVLVVYAFLSMYIYLLQCDGTREPRGGALPGWTDELGGYWSQSYQARILSAGATRVVQDDRWSGIALWQLMDQRVYNGAEALSRPRAFNNKGTFDQNRKAKEPAWAAVQAAFAGQPPPAFVQAELGVST